MYSHQSLEECLVGVVIERRETVIEATVGAFIVGTFLLIMGVHFFVLGLNDRWRELFMRWQFRPKHFIPFEKVSFLVSAVISLLLGLFALGVALYRALN